MYKRSIVFIAVLIAYAFVWSWSKSSNRNSSDLVIQQMNQKDADAEEQNPMSFYLGEFTGTVVPFLLLWWLADKAAVKWLIIFVVISITTPGFSEPCTVETLGRGACTYSTNPTVFKRQHRWVQEFEMLQDLRLRQQHLTDVLASLRRLAAASDNPHPQEATATGDIIEKELEYLNAWIGLVNTWQQEDKKALVEVPQRKR